MVTVRRVRHGLMLAPFGQLADPRVVAEMAADAERAGFDGVFLWDHMYRAEPFRPVADPWVTLAAVAAATERVRLGPLVTPVARRRPQKLARETTTLDHLSGGRLVLGVGLGVNTGRELTRFGEEDDPRLRGDRLDEGVELLCRLWSGEEVTHHGRHFTADDVRFEPRPLQEPRIPIWVAAPSGKGRPLRRAARYDGICTDVGLADAPALLERLRRERGDLDGFDVVVMGAPGAESRGWEAAGATWWIVDFPDPVDPETVAGLIADGPPS
jgi:alkanesulfonate monooxygenase SsuD/methylene tetrahydromethanopterin reductase-like flavin-dependent oxidoreductase (luciferase family)